MRDPRKLKAAAVEDLIENPPPSIAEGWRTRLIKSERGKRLPVVANVLIALRHAPEWQGVLHYNESSLDVVAKAVPPWEETRKVPFTWTDEDDVRVAAWCQHMGILAGRETAGQAVQTIAREHPFHPIRDYFDSLTWDGVSRIDDWLVLYIGADPSDYARAVGAKWLIGAVARTYRPGCKNDTCLIFEGPQGTLKSTALRVLAEPWVTDDMPELGNKDSALQTRGVLLIELSELDSMAKSEVSRIKSFISRNADRFRPPFGRRPIEAPRECVFAGSSNHTSYLRDETGGRRFWPIRCGKINIAELKRDKDQLWAEARDRFRAGASWWLDERRLVDAAVEEQKQRYEGDPWDEAIYTWAEGKESVTIEGILGPACLDKLKGTWTQADKIRISRSLVAQGWKRYQHCEGKRREWRYRPSPVSPV